MNTRTNDLIPPAMLKRKLDLSLNKLVFFRSDLFRKGDYFPLSDVLMLASQAVMLNVNFAIYEQDGGDLWLQYSGSALTSEKRECIGEFEVYEMVKRHAGLLGEFAKSLAPA